jgi:Xaa-Pro dipeptidase
MDQYYREARKIDPTRGSLLPDGTHNDADRVEIGPTQLAFREWEGAGLTLPHLPTMRRYRWERLTEVVRRIRTAC